MTDFYTQRQEKDQSAFLNSNITKWCCLCATHKPQLGGGLRHVFGARHWVCSKHKKPNAKT